MLIYMKNFYIPEKLLKSGFVANVKGEKSHLKPFNMALQMAMFYHIFVRYVIIHDTDCIHNGSLSLKHCDRQMRMLSHSAVIKALYTCIPICSK